MAVATSVFHQRKTIISQIVPHPFWILAIMLISKWQNQIIFKQNFTAPTYKNFRHSSLARNSSLRHEEKTKREKKKKIACQKQRNIEWTWSITASVPPATTAMNFLSTCRRTLASSRQLLLIDSGINESPARCRSPEETSSILSW